MLLFPLFFVFFACGDRDGSGGGTCPGGAYSCGQRCGGATPPAECGQTCGASTPCPAGFYCGGNGTCTSDCATGGDSFCPNGVCTATGMCEAPPSTGGGTGGGNGDPDASICARESVNATAVTPNVVFLVDRSKSMQGELDITTIECPCGDATSPVPYDCYGANECLNPELSRWDILRDVLIGTGGADTGLIGSLETQVAFGLAMYTEDDIPQGCPDMTYAPPNASGLLVGLNQYDEIRTVYSTASPGLYTPTGDAVNALMNELDSTGVLADPDPTIIVLATDGEPGRCDNPGDVGSTTSRNAAVTAVANAYSQNVRTFVIAVASDKQLAADHVNALANAGVGDPSGTTFSAPSWRVNSVSSLQTALQSIVQGQISCTVKLQGEVTDLTQGCAQGDVAFVGPSNARTPIACDPVNGWTLIDASTMELRGTACATLKNTPGLTIDANFPCDLVIVVL